MQRRIVAGQETVAHRGAVGEGRRGTDRRQYPWGNEAVDGKRANYATCSVIRHGDTREKDGYSYTAPVGSFPSGKSPYGIEDLAGNVWEWVQDRYAADYYRRSPERNPVNDAPAEFRVLRGGGWHDPPAPVRAANRNGIAPVTATSTSASGVWCGGRPSGRSPFCFDPFSCSFFRFSHGEPGEEQLWGILDLLIEAAYTRHKLPLLEQSNLRLQKLRFLARVCKDRQCLSLSAAHRNYLASLARGKSLL